MAIRVVQWATGAMGKTCLRAILDHPDLELVGLYVYSDEKVGRDAGEIARREPVGVAATDRIEEILALDADVVVQPPRLRPPYAHHNADIQRFLASGKNAISCPRLGTSKWRPAGVDIAVKLKRPDGDPFKTSPEQWALAASVVNAIPDACAAPAGLIAPPMARPFRARFRS